VRTGYKKDDGKYKDIKSNFYLNNSPK
jgi:hypothetical protein